MNTPEEEVKFLKKLGNPIGFFELYFIELKTSRTNQEAFERINEKHFQSFNFYRYLDYKSFIRARNRMIEQHKL